MMWRLVDSCIAEPEFTVAADEAIALARSEGLVPDTLHFYRRSEPTISMGYFQEAEKALDMRFCRENGLKILRRATGGSAIYTDEGHLIYGMAVGEDMLPADRNQAFAKVCGAIVLALKDMGIQAEFKPVNDVLVGGRKISGSAQRRLDGAVLLHGTLVMRNSPEMMLGALRMDNEKIRSRGQEPGTYVTSLEEQLGKMPDPEQVKGAVAAAFGKAFDAEIVPGELTGWEKDRISQLISEKYGNDAWNLRR